MWPDWAISDWFCQEISLKCSPNIWQLLGLFLKCLFLSTNCFGQFWSHWRRKVFPVMQSAAIQKFNFAYFGNFAFSSFLHSVLSNYERLLFVLASWLAGWRGATKTHTKMQRTFISLSVSLSTSFSFYLTLHIIHSFFHSLPITLYFFSFTITFIISFFFCWFRPLKDVFLLRYYPSSSEQAVGSKLSYLSLLFYLPWCSLSIS